MREEEAFEKHRSDLLKSAEVLDRVFTVMDEVHQAFGVLFAEWYRIREALLDLDLLDEISLMEGALQGVEARLDMLFSPGSALGDSLPHPEPERGSATLGALEHHVARLADEVERTQPKVNDLVEALSQAVEPLQRAARDLQANGEFPLVSADGDPSESSPVTLRSIEKFIEALLEMRAACEHVASTMKQCEPSLNVQRHELAAHRKGPRKDLPKA